MSSCEQPVFVVGAPRSGTTLLRSMLDAHPNICCPTWETGVFDRLGPMLKGDMNKPRGREANFFAFERRELVAWIRRAVDDLMGHLTASSGKSRWGEKTPAHVFQMDAIHEVYPQAQFLHIVRDGRDVVRSLQNVNWAPGNARWSVRRWIHSVQAGRGFGRGLGPRLYCEIRYEDLLDEPRPQLERVCEFLGEPFAEQMLEFDKPQNNSWGIEQPALQPKSAQRNYRPLSLAERTTLWWLAAPLLKELGYA